MALGEANKFNLTTVAVALAVGVATGSSAANPDLVSQSTIIGFVPTGVAGSTGFGLIDTVTLNANGSITVTTRAVVATQNLTVNVLVATVSNS